VGGLQNGQEIKRIEEGEEITRAGISGVTGARWETTLTGGSHLSAGEREGEVYQFGVLGWAVGHYWRWAGRVPRGPFIFSFPFLFLFLFLFS
jgi:hypothetical protein